MLTIEELERRRQFITATDVAALFGVSPWANAADVYLQKTRGIVKPTNAAMEAGSLLEPSVLKWAETKLGVLLPGDWRVGENGINAATLDALTMIGEPVEAKTSGITGPGSPHQWGEEGTDEIPPYYQLQVHTQLLVTGAKIGFVPVLIGGRGFVLYQIRRVEAICDRIAQASEQFWREHVEADIPPENVTAHLDTLKLLRRVPRKQVVIPDEVAEAFVAAKEAAKEAEAAEKEATAALLSAMDDAESAKWSGGEFTYYEQTRKGYTVEECTFRVLRLKAAKKAKALA